MSPEKLFLILLNRSLAACWLVLALIILRPFLRRVSRSLCCAMWGLVAFRLLCPFSFRSVLSLIPSAEPIPTELPSAQTVITDGGLSAAGQIGETVMSVPSVTAPAPVSPTQILTGIWLAGFAMFVLYALFSTLRLYIRVRDSVRQEDDYWMCDWINAPFVIGCFRPRIILPFRVDRRDIPYILAHERAHLARHDHWRKPIAFLLLAVFWFQPVFWVAYYLLRRDVEFACDEYALRSLGSDRESKAGYAKALLQCSSPKAYAARFPSPLAFGGLQVKRRVRSVLAYKRPAAVRLFAALLVCAVVAVCFLTDPKVGAGSPVDVPENTLESFSSETEKTKEESTEKLPVTNTVSSWRDEYKMAEAIVTPIEPSVVDDLDDAANRRIYEKFFYCFRHLSYTGTCQNLFYTGICPDLFYTGICQGTDSGTVLLFTNDGDEDASITFLFSNKGDGQYATALVTVLMPAGQKVAYDCGSEWYASVVNGASYGDVSALFPLRAYTGG